MRLLIQVAAEKHKIKISLLLFYASRAIHVHFISFPLEGMQD